MKRRNFLRGAAAVTTLPVVLNGLSVRALGRSPVLEAVLAGACDDHVLVLIQMIGGNDGLNTIIPLDQYSTYRSVRSNIAIDEASILKLTNETGIHPQMNHLSQMYHNGLVRVVQGVGYPTPNYSHFRSTDIWLTASDHDQIEATGWMGRFLEREYPGFPDGYPNATMPHPLAIQIGSVISPGLEGTSANMGMAFTDPNSYFNINNANTAPGVGQRAGEELAYVRTIGQQIEKFATPVKDAASKATNKSTKYPAARQNPLADQLKIVAQLIAGGLKTRIYICQQVGYDTHSYQVQGGPGSPVPHGTLLNQLSAAIDAFQDDLRLLNVQDRVVGMTFSEFGRRITSNASGGTDHGAAAPIILFGSNVVSGVLGSNPTIPSDASPEDNLPMQFDFRSVYATLLKDWFCVPPDVVATTLFRNFNSVAIIKGGSPTSITDTLINALDPISLRATPNPARDFCTIAFNAPQGSIEIDLFDSTGRQVLTLHEGGHNGGGGVVTTSLSRIPSGTYHIRMQTGGQVKMSVVSVVK